MAFLLNPLKLFLISTWLFFTALGLNLSLPTITHFFATQVPLTWNLCLTCLSLKPPFLFLLLNAIILSIAASSRFHRPTPPPPPSAYVAKPPPPPPPLPIEDESPAIVDVKPVVVNGVAAAEEDGTVTTECRWTATEMTPPTAPTLEEVWKAITEGRPRAAKRSVTMKERRRNPMVCAATTTVRKLKPQQLSQDELNRRVEAFIRKFNEEMRLQNCRSNNH